MTDNLKYFVIDEADTTFKFFPEKIRTLINFIKLRENVIMQLVSATLNKETINEFTKIIKSKEKFQSLENKQQEDEDDENEDEDDDDEIHFISIETTLEGVYQFYIDEDEEEIKEQNKDQEVTEDSRLDFRKGNFDLLFATNIIAHGIDIRTVGLVINLDCPLGNIKERNFEVDHETYLHRVGRTGRYNDLGVGITLVDKNSIGIVQKVKQVFNQDILKFDEKVVVQRLNEVIENNNKQILK
ncbi:hypothetical protein IMG5_171780 [Ichthyophthirius multifiliis]|uniref:Helicase C-terminal domain-containing protein n=1 Tax=Ichthyophthirius multifiliis TaxID=5932 RepID=G0R1N9_ICHMU|nr:hypothetical protein IMG5_171780 [Ichthyophthirius multifiliis]EGR28616.1 hypothetical protein IMG5_171780 [Ichthyophthirius multifiliis]|eukprot:XP_004029852.1 hypothetical protein IMG5_171780 [Ichthyophthirius multifiliis]